MLLGYSFVTLAFLFLGVTLADEDYPPEFSIPSSSTISLTVTITEEFLNIITYSLEPFIEDLLTSITFDDISGSASTAIGNIEYGIKDILIESVSIGDFYFSGDEESDTISVDFDNAELRVDFNYYYQMLSWPYTTEEGSGYVSADGVTFTGSAQILQNATTGGMEIELYDSAMNINDFLVHLDGGILATIVDLFEELFADTINELIASVLQGVIEWLFTEFTEMFNGSALSDCDEDICIDIRLGADMIMESAAFSFDMGGTFFWGLDQSGYAAPDTWPDIPEAVNEKAIQYTWGANTFETYFAAMTAAGYFADVACDSANSQGCGMTDDASAYLTAAAVAQSFPEFAAAYPDSDASVRVSLVSTPVPELMYSAVEVPFELVAEVAPFDAQMLKTGPVAASFRVDLTTAADVDFKGFHGTPQDTAINENRAHVTMEFSKYSVAAVVEASALGDVAVTAELEGWLEAVLFETAVWGLWGQSVNTRGFPYLRVDLLDYVDRVVVYTPNYVAMTVDVVVAADA